MSPIQGISFNVRCHFRKHFSAHRFALQPTTRIKSKPKEYRECSSQGHAHHPVENAFPSLCGPSVKKLLAEYGIQFSNVPNSGPRGNLLKGDILTYIRDRKLSLIPSTAKGHIEVAKSIIKKGRVYDDVSVSPSRKTSAQQSILSKTTIPHAYVNIECNIDKVFEYQKRMQQDGFEVSLNDFLVKSAASALRKVPEMNIMNNGMHIKSLECINIAVTGATDYASSIVRKADSLTVQLISEQMSRSCKEEIIDVSLRIFNLGASGVSEFKAVIHPPEVAVLAVGAVRCVYEEPGLVQKLRLSLSFNNEAVSDEVAASFVHWLKEHLENPLSVCLA